MKHPTFSLFKLKLPTKIALLCLGPSLLLLLIFSIFFIEARVDDVEETLKRQGSNILLHLSPEIHLDFVNQNIKRLEEAIRNIKIKYPDIDKLSLIDDHGTLVTGDPSPFALDELIKNFTLPDQTPTDGYETVILEDSQNFYFLMKLDDIEGPHNFGFLVLSIPASTAHLLEKRAILTSVAFILVMVTFYIFLTLILNRYLSQPINLMIESAKKIQKHQHSAPLSFKSFKEFELLKNTWNTMEESLEKSTQIMTQKIKEATAQLEQNNLELNEARLKALAGEKVKAEFLANMSHEIRTPLNAILGFTDLILEEKLKPHQEEHLLIVKKSAQSLLQILNDILDFSKIEAGKLLIHPEPIPLKSFLEDILMLFISQAHQHSLYLWLQIYPDVPEIIQTDPLRLKQILMNLMGNALKFTPEGSIVLKASLTPEETHLRLEIIDTGIGLTPGDQSRLFQAFSQADTSATRQYGGTGLGLIICKKLTQLLNGEIGLKSQKGQGSTFWIDIPLKEESPSTFPSARKEVISSRSLAGIKVAVLEPTQVGRLSFLQHLEQENMAVTLCSTIEALRATVTSKTPPNLLILSSTCAESLLSDFAFPLAQKIPTILFAPESYSALTQTLKKFAHALPSLSIKTTLSIPYTQNQLRAVIEKALHLPAHSAKSSVQKNFITPEACSASPLKVLVVDDHENNRHLLITILKKLGIPAEGASNGQDAIDWVLHHPAADLIFMDIQMPGMDGFTAAQKIRQLPGGETIKIFALTADINEVQQEKVKTSGLNGYYLKPISYSALNQVLKETLQKKAGEEIKAPVSLKSLPTELLSINEEDEITQRQIQELPETYAHIQQALEENHREKLSQILHKFHGGLCYTTLQSLRSKVKAAEQTLKNLPPETDFEKIKNLPVLQALLQHLRALFKVR